MRISTLPMIKTLLFSLVFCWYATGLHADVKAETAKIQAKVNKEIQDYKKKSPINLANNLPTYNASNWRTYVLAQKDITTGYLIAPNRSLIYVGQNIKCREVRVEGDGIIYFNGQADCQKVKVTGKGVIVYNGNSVPFYGADVIVGQGMIVAKDHNNARIGINKGGFFYCGGKNQAEFTLAGTTAIKIDGNQIGNITLLQGAANPSMVEIAESMFGNLDSLQNCNFKVGKNLVGNVKVMGNLKLKARDLISKIINISGHLETSLRSLDQSRGDDPIELGSGVITADLKHHGDINVAKDLVLTVGGYSRSSIDSNGGSVTVSSKADQVGNIKARLKANVNARTLIGNVKAGSDMTINSRKALGILEAGANGVVVADQLKGQVNVGKHLTLKSKIVRRGDFGDAIHAGSADIKVDGDCHAAIRTRGNLKVNGLGKFTQLINAGGDADITIGNHCYGDIYVGKNAKVKVSGDMKGSTDVTGNASSIDYGLTHGSIVVKGTAGQITTRGTKSVSKDNSLISLKSGKVEIKGDNEFNVKAQDDVKMLIHGNSKGKFSSNNTASIEVKGGHKGDLKTGKTLNYKAGSQRGKINAGDKIAVSVRGTHHGDVNVARNAQQSSFKAGEIVDSNIKVEGNASVHAGQINSTKDQTLSLHIGNGEVVVKEDIHSDIVANGDAIIRARSIYGDVLIGGNPKIDAMVHKGFNKDTDINKITLDVYGL